jgi:hypothetical protein
VQTQVVNVQDFITLGCHHFTGYAFLIRYEMTYLDTVGLVVDLVRAHCLDTVKVLWRWWEEEKGVLLGLRKLFKVIVWIAT